MIDHDDAISQPRLKRMTRLSEHKSWQYDIWIDLRDKKAVFFKVTHLLLNLFELILQDFFSLGCRSLHVVLGLELLQFFFSLRNELTWFIGFLRPAIAREWLKVCR